MEYILITNYEKIDDGDILYVIIPGINSSTKPMEVTVETIFKTHGNLLQDASIKFKSFVKSYKLDEVILFHLENI